MFDETWRFGDCPWCGLRDTEFRVLAGLTAPLPNGALRHYTACSCPRCGKPVLFNHNSPNEVPPNLLEVIPAGEQAVGVRNLPDDVASYYADAKRVLDAGVPDAAAVQLRRTLEAAAARFGHTENQLLRRIKGLIDDGLITRGFGDVLHLVRQVGNLGAHASDHRVDEPTARAVFDLTTQILRNLFEIPHVLDELKGRSPEPPPEGAGGQAEGAS